MAHNERGNGNRQPPNEEQRKTEALTREIEERAYYAELVGELAAEAAAMTPIDRDKEKVSAMAARIVATMITLATKTPALRYCTRESLAQVIADSLALDLMPGGHRVANAYLIPRENRRSGTWEVSLQLSARGMATLAQREGWVLTSEIVFEGERFELVAGTQPGITHVPDITRQGEIPLDLSTVVCAYVTAQRPGYSTVFRWMTRDQILKRRETSDSFKADLKYGKTADKWNAGIWMKWPDEMIKKTAIAFALARTMIPLGDNLSYALRVIDAESGAEPPKLDPPTGADSLGLQEPEEEVEEVEEVAFEDRPLEEQIDLTEMRLAARKELGSVEAVRKATGARLTPDRMNMAQRAKYLEVLLNIAWDLDHPAG